MTSTPIHSETPLEDFDLVLKAGRADKNYWQDLWRYRELFIILALRDISVRYKQTVIGVAWALIQPFLNMLVMTVVFGKVAGLKSDGTSPYALMVFAGMLPWMFLQLGVDQCQPEHGREREPHLQGLLSPAHRPGQRGRHRLC